VCAELEKNTEAIIEDRDLRGGIGAPDLFASARALSSAASVYSTSNQAVTPILAAEDENNLAFEEVKGMRGAERVR